MMNIALLPFSENLDFLSKDFDKEIENLKKINCKYKIMCFYIKSFYRKTLNAIIIKDKKIVCVIGEFFSKKSFYIKKLKCEVVFVFHKNLHKLLKNNKNKTILILDDASLDEILPFNYQKFVYILKNGEFFSKKSDFLIKKMKKFLYFYVQTE